MHDKLLHYQSLNKSLLTLLNANSMSSHLLLFHIPKYVVLSVYKAQLIDWQPAGQKPCLWLSSESAFKEGVAIRGGIPICWPWFGPVASPSHGFARIYLGTRT